MKRLPTQSYLAEPGARNNLLLTDLDSTEYLHQQPDRSKDDPKQNQNQPVQNRDSTKVNQLPEIESLEPDRFDNGQSPLIEASEVDNLTETAELEDTKTKPEQRKTNHKRRIWLLGIGAIVLSLGSVFGLRWWQFQTTHVSTENAQIKGHLSPISARVAATVQQVAVKDGDAVKAGQTLLVLEDQDLYLKLQQATANLAAAQAQLKAARDTVSVTSQTNPTQVQQAQSGLAAKAAAANAAQANVSQAQAKVDTSRASVAQAQTALTQTQADFRRYESLYREGAIPAQQFDAARAAFENAQAALAAANQTVAQNEAAVSSSQAQLQTAQAEVEAARGQVTEQQASGQSITVQKDQQQQAQAQVEQAEAALALARQQITYTVIKAPIDGYVGQFTAQVGQKVQPGQPLLSVVPLQADEVYVDANFKETALGKLRIGEKAEVEVDAYPGETFRATIAGISPATGSSFALIPPDNATGNFNKVVQWVPIRLVFDRDTDSQHKLRPGLSVQVTVDTTTNAPAESLRAAH